LRCVTGTTAADGGTPDGGVATDAGNCSQCNPSTPCCNGNCAPAHSNGLGDFYYDCRPLGLPTYESTYTHAMAIEAMNAWQVQATTIASGTTTCGPFGQYSTCDWKLTADSCAMWCYTGPQAGYANSISSQCYCPGTLAFGDRAWR